MDLVPCRTWGWVWGPLSFWSSSLLSPVVLTSLHIIEEVLLLFGPESIRWIRLGTGSDQHCSCSLELLVTLLRFDQQLLGLAAGEFLFCPQLLLGLLLNLLLFCQLPLLGLLFP